MILTNCPGYGADSVEPCVDPAVILHKSNSLKNIETFNGKKGFKMGDNWQRS